MHHRLYCICGHNWGRQIMHVGVVSSAWLQKHGGCHAVNKCGDNRWRGLTTKDPTTQLLKAAPPRSQNEPIIQLFSVDWRRVEPISAEWLRDWNGSDMRFSSLDTQASEEHPAPHHCYKDKRLVLIRQSCVTYSCEADGTHHYAMAEVMKVTERRSYRDNI